jgi:hypothetical protein
MTEKMNIQLIRLTALLQMEQRVRRAAREELPFIMVNETASLIPYQQAILWQTEGQGRVLAVSGVAVPDPRSPFLTWCSGMIRRLPIESGGRVIQRLDPEGLSPEQRKGWQEWLPPSGLWVPLLGPGQDLVASLLFFRQEAWGDAELKILEYLSDAFGHAYALSSVRYRPRRAKAATLYRKLRLAVGLILLLLACAYPIRESVLAPAEVAPRQPALVRAPLEGVVDRFHVEPNETVKAGQLLLSLDDTDLKSRLEVAEKTRDIVKTELLQAAQMALSDARAKAMLAVLHGKVQQQEADVSYYRSLLERIQVKSPQDGIAVFNDPGEWTGRPVMIGQRILVIADPAQIELEVNLPVNDAITLEPGAEVQFFLNIAPVRPLKAHLSFASYSSFITPEKIAAYRLRASLDASEERPRIGLKGTAKIYGKRTPAVLWVMRKPLAFARRSLGL